ncbi:MAG: DUF805 domain-containing protein [Victivallales bacterium]|nr:DUF805 domain-containing protein [Victivallales bacterium]
MTEQQSPEEMMQQAGEFARQQSRNQLDLLIHSLKNSFSFEGRATRMEYWTFIITVFLLNIILFGVTTLLGFISKYLGVPFGVLTMFLNIFLIFPTISVTVRRLHDLNLSGFWIWYLSSFGLPIVFLVSLLDLDKSCSSVMEKVNKSCTNWVSWLLLPFFWFFGAPSVQFILYLYKGKDEDNDFGPSPYR